MYEVDRGRLRRIVEYYMKKVPEVRELCSRCLATERWNGSVVLMVVDAAFTSIGLNYFQAVVPKVEEFRRRFVETGRIRRLEDLASADIEELRETWKNRRSWDVAVAVAAYLAEIKKEKGLGDREAFIHWAGNSSLRNWRKDGIGRIRGVGINTYQYLRMMGGVDTVMPDKIVKRVINQILAEAGGEPVEEDMSFIATVHRIASLTGYRAIELCWMTWMLQEEGSRIRAEKYAELLPYI